MIPDNKTIKEFDYAHGDRREEHKTQEQEDAFYLTKWIRRNFFWNGEIEIRDNAIHVYVPKHLKQELKKVHRDNKLPKDYKFSSGEILKVICSYAK